MMPWPPILKQVPSWCDARTGWSFQLMLPRHGQQYFEGSGARPIALLSHDSLLLARSCSKASSQSCGASPAGRFSWGTGCFSGALKGGVGRLPNRVVVTLSRQFDSCRSSSQKPRPCRFQDVDAPASSQNRASLRDREARSVGSKLRPSVPENPRRVGREPLGEGSQQVARLWAPNGRARLLAR